MRYAIDLGNRTGKTVVFPFAKSGHLQLNDEHEKRKFLDSLTSVDIIYAEHGGGGEYFLAGALQRGAGVFRISGKIVKERREKETKKGLLARSNDEASAAVIRMLAEEQSPEFAALHTPVQWRDWIVWKHASAEGRTLGALLTQVEIYEQLSRRVGNQVEALEREVGLVITGDELVSLIKGSRYSSGIKNGLLKVIGDSFNLIFGIKLKSKKSKGGESVKKSALIREHLDKMRYALSHPIDRLCRENFPEWGGCGIKFLTWELFRAPN